MASAISDLVLAMTPDLDSLSSSMNTALQGAMQTSFSSPELRSKAVAKTRSILRSIERIRNETEPVLVVSTHTVGFPPVEVEDGREFVAASKLTVAHVSTRTASVEVYDDSAVLQLRG